MINCAMDLIKINEDYAIQRELEKIRKQIEEEEAQREYQINMEKFEERKKRYLEKVNADTEKFCQNLLDTKITTWAKENDISQKYYIIRDYVIGYHFRTENFMVEDFFADYTSGYDKEREANYILPIYDKGVTYADGRHSYNANLSQTELNIDAIKNFFEKRCFIVNIEEGYSLVKYHFSRGRIKLISISIQINFDNIKCL